MTQSSTPPAPGYPPQPPTSAKPPGRGLAIASLVLGILGPCTVGLGSVIGIILGIVALVKLSKAGAASGKGLAIAGLVVSGLGLLLLPVIGMVVAIMVPAVTTARGHAYQAAFTSNLKQLSVAAMAYTAERDGRLPPADAWQGTFEQQGLLGDVGRMTSDPGDPDAGRAVAMNAAVGGMPVDAIRMPSRTVLFFECAPGSPPAGGPDLLPPEPRYARGYVVAFVDGHVETVRFDEVGNLVWDPGGP
jgi:prepilin-type processing-associated H-X9-DG protein